MTGSKSNGLASDSVGGEPKLCKHFPCSQTRLFFFSLAQGDTKISIAMRLYKHVHVQIDPNHNSSPAFAIIIHQVQEHLGRQ